MNVVVIDIGILVEIQGIGEGVMFVCLILDKLLDMVLGVCDMLFVV